MRPYLEWGHFRVCIIDAVKNLLRELISDMVWGFAIYLVVAVIDDGLQRVLCIWLREWVANYGNAKMKYAYMFSIFVGLVLVVFRVCLLYKWSKKNGYGEDSYEKFLTTEWGGAYRVCSRVIAAALLLSLVIYLIT